MERVILHSDLNNFYASVECLYNPELRNKPVAVCGSQSTRHGIVLAKNIIAKNLGVKTGEAIWEARAKCSELVVVRPSYAQYLKFSTYARRIYENYTNLIEAFGIDENWLDVTESTRLFGSGEEIAEQIRKRIYEELGVTVSIGVSYNKIFAKLGSDLKKPNAVTPITHDDYKVKVWPLPVQDLMYVGPSTWRKLNNVGIYTIGELAVAPIGLLKRMLGQWGESLWIFANGYDETPVTRLEYQPEVKGVGNSLTTPRDLRCNEDVKIITYVLADSVAERLRRHNLKGRTVQLYIRSSDLSSEDRQAPLDNYTFACADIASRAYELFLSCWDWSKTIRTFGIRVTNLVQADNFMQLSLFEECRHVKRELLDKSIDGIRSRFGHYSVQRALLLKDRGLNANPVEENVIHPVSYRPENPLKQA